MEDGQLDGVFGSSNHVYYLISQGKLGAPLDFRYKSHFYALGATILGKEAPQNWKVYTQTLLLANERQFIKL